MLKSSERYHVEKSISEREIFRNTPTSFIYVNSPQATILNGILRNFSVTSLVVSYPDLNFRGSHKFDEVNMNLMITKV